MIYNIEQQKGYLNISYVGTDGKTKYEKIVIPEEEQYNWQYATSLKDADPVFRSWDNRRVSKNKSTYLSGYRIEELMLKLDQSVKDKLFSPDRPQMWFCDIEVEVTDTGFPDAETAPNVVTAICLVVEQRVLVLGLKPLSEYEIKSIEDSTNEYFSKWNKNYSVKYLQFDTEYDMISMFFNKVMQKVTLLTGWNFIDYDWQYLVNRAIKLNIEPNVASPTKILIGKNRIPEHRPIIDYKEVFEKYDKSLDIKESMALEYIAEAALGKGKIKFSGNFDVLYNTQFQKYIYYNIVDTILVQIIHEQYDTIGPLFMLATMMGVELTRATGPVWMSELTILREFIKENKVLVRKKYEDSIENTDYEGAFCKPPVPGMYEWVVAFDFASLYPTTMRQFNISPETFIGKTNTDKEGYVKTASGAVFNNAEDSVSRNILSKYFNDRKKKKKEWQTAEKNIKQLQKILETK